MSSSSFFQREPVHGGERQIHKQADPAIQKKNASRKAFRTCSSVPFAAAGSGMVMQRAEFPVHRKSTL